MERKEVRAVAIYARVSKENNVWMRGEMKRLGYKSFSEYLNAALTESRKTKVDSHAKKLSKRN